MKVRQQRCNMTKEYKLDIARTKTTEGVGLPYSIVAQIIPAENQVAIENDIVKQFRQDKPRERFHLRYSCFLSAL